MPDKETVPRGRHAPPPEIRQDRQRRRLFSAAASVFARVGYADATAEAIAREAGMSKATFYEHFENKEDCIIALFDTATETILGAMAAAVSNGEQKLDPPTRYRRQVVAFLEGLATSPEASQTLLVEVIGAGPRAMERRDRVLNAFAMFIDERNREDAEAGLVPRLASPDDAFAIVGATVELASRQLRTKEPKDIRDLEPVIERLIHGALMAAEREQAAAR
jgi:AcrR family transcriptional regulator